MSSGNRRKSASGDELGHDPNTTQENTVTVDLNTMLNEQDLLSATLRPDASSQAFLNNSLGQRFLGQSQNLAGLAGLSSSSSNLGASIPLDRTMDGGLGGGPGFSSVGDLNASMELGYRLPSGIPGLLSSTVSMEDSLKLGIDHQQHISSANDSLRGLGGNHLNQGVSHTSAVPSSSSSSSLSSAPASSSAITTTSATPASVREDLAFIAMADSMRALSIHASGGSLSRHPSAGQSTTSSSQTPLSLHSDTSIASTSSPTNPFALPTTGAFAILPPHSTTNPTTEGLPPMDVTGDRFSSAGLGTGLGGVGGGVSGGVSGSLIDSMEALREREGQTGRVVGDGNGGHRRDYGYDQHDDRYIYGGDHDGEQDDDHPDRRGRYEGGRVSNEGVRLGVGDDDDISLRDPLLYPGHGMGGLTLGEANDGISHRSNSGEGHEIKKKGTATKSQGVYGSDDGSGLGGEGVGVGGDGGGNEGGNGRTVAPKRRAHRMSTETLEMESSAAEGLPHNAISTARELERIRQETLREEAATRGRTVSGRRLANPPARYGGVSGVVGLGGGGGSSSSSSRSGSAGDEGEKKDKEGDEMDDGEDDEDEDEEDDDDPDPGHRRKMRRDNTNKTRQQKRKAPGCNCRKSRCVKRYCECYAAMKYCTPECQCCDDCINQDTEECRILVAQHRVATQKRNSQAFNKDEKQKSVTCNCVRSGCQKNYCHCYQAGVGCVAECKCIDCLNNKDDNYHIDTTVGKRRGKGNSSLTTGATGTSGNNNGGEDDYEDDAFEDG